MKTKPKLKTKLRTMTNPNTKQKLKFIGNRLFLLPIHDWKQGTNLQRGSNPANKVVLDKCAKIKQKYLCYYFRDDSTILYIGSTTKDYSRSIYRSNFATRISKYLGHHGGITNVRVFEEIIDHLVGHNVELGVFVFESVEIGNETVPFAEASEDSDIILTLERLLICFYRRTQGSESLWNR